MALSGADGAILIKPLTARFGVIDTRVEARISESFALTDSSASFEVSGPSLSALTSLDGMPISDHPFRVAGQLSFADEETVKVQALEASYGPANARGELKLSLADPIAAGEIRIEAEGDSLTDIAPAAAEYVGTDTGFRIVGAGRWREDSLWLEDTSIRVGEITVDVQGEVHAPPELAGTALTLDASLPSLRALELAVGQPLPDEPLTVQAEVQAEADAFRLSTFALRLGQSDLSGTAEFQPAGKSQEVPRITVDLKSTLLDLRPLQTVHLPPNPATRRRQTKRMTGA